MHPFGVTKLEVNSKFEYKTSRELMKLDQLMITHFLRANLPGSEAMALFMLIVASLKSRTCRFTMNVLPWLIDHDPLSGALLWSRLSNPGQ